MPLTVKVREVCYYEENERRPCEDWINSLKDKKGKAKILGRINRARNGNFGDREASVRAKDSAASGGPGPLHQTTATKGT